MSLKSIIESLFFVSNKPFSIKKLSQILKIEEEKIKEKIQELIKEYDNPDKGITIIKKESEYQMATNPQNTTIIQNFLKEETMGELTKPSLETLAIIAYRGPITKPELEQIRGINCSLILRNLLIKGLIETRENTKLNQISYIITFDFMRYLGINDIKNLPDYEKLSKNKSLDDFLKN
ncbi:SMC-Scp complex subunit ScpB [Candidatus Kuenenbacteria bacterium HGW-Kuenenbacteria-1]|uniref:SMC-Scp complex subunit ScpB n=1 Tax=Candidatus Kuenenbacteria bacterium HGW-Kuenenbacteria-1 TaxID=2013812 RepID=A0A2N1UP13_9BACT|nr:MAG: SMC-Scp complex subunit ScpB [Candidatus Kuenenbacteria bacterium HGW-Kuenenbacteria-1]